MATERTCIGCRGKASKDALIRIVSRDHELVLDQAQTLPGRGAWLHPTDACFAGAVSRRAFGRALRVSGDLDTGHLSEQVERLMDK